MLPHGDRTPVTFAVPKLNLFERVVKRPVRRYVYPPYKVLVDQWLSRIYGKQLQYDIDHWLWGQRGNDLESHRRRVNRFCNLAGKSIVVAGCGTGRDIASWLPYEPMSVTGIDYFSYDAAWKLLKEEAARKFPKTRLVFLQADLAQQGALPPCSIDVVGSDAVFEHLADFSAVLSEFHRMLKVGGILYATFGPLWYCWGGDHISGYDGLAGGYNHLLLDESAYRDYLEAAGPHAHSEHDGRTWIAGALFSYLAPGGYLASLSQAGYRKLYTAAIIEPRAFKFHARYPAAWRRLEQLAPDPLALLITGMTVVYEKSVEPCT